MGVTNAADRKLFFVRLKGTKKGESPIFIVKDADTKKIINEGNQLSGAIKDIKPHTYEYEGKKVRGYKMEIVDGDETFLIGLSYTTFSRTILNCLSTVEKAGYVAIKVKEAGDGDNGYPSIFVDMDGIHLKWKWKFADLDKLVDRSGESPNYIKLDKSMDEVISETLGPLFRNSFNQVVSAGPAIVQTEVHDEVLDKREEEEHVDQSIRREDIDVSSEMPEGAGKTAEEPVQEEPPIGEEQDDLPF